MSCILMERDAKLVQLFQAHIFVTKLSYDNEYAEPRLVFIKATKREKILNYGFTKN